MFPKLWVFRRKLGTYYIEEILDLGHSLDKFNRLELFLLQGTLKGKLKAHESFIVVTAQSGSL